MIRIVKYILILAAVAMLYKTFYYDYQEKEIPAEVNTSTQAPEVIEPEPQAVVPAEPVKATNTDENNKTGWQSRKGMPIDRLGDSIGDSLKDKIKVK
ncbi:MAG: hypothetical protein Q8S36_00255 [Sulfuricurvum sp.]|nr:hypothetical protein [Sulfuricurvum sp.]